MRYQELTELRREHERNLRASPKYRDGHREAVRILGTLSNLDRYGVTMTEIPKVGINPKSRYNTPIGIYFYPASYYYAIKSKGGTLPFADSEKYINIIQLTTPRILHIDSIDESDLSDEINLMKHTLPKLLKITDSPAKMEKFYRELSVAAETAHKGCEVPNPGGHLWYILWLLSKNYSKSYTRAAPMWNRMFQALYIDVVIDEGDGIIYHAEPHQGVILNTAGTYKVIARLHNKLASAEKPEEIIPDADDLYLSDFAGNFSGDVAGWTTE